ncbi:TlpA disulfide reductase family protein [Sutcliffiella sp. NPDC057660]|uniref:TlpA disulfide reductase family protein n=1 Tax=Sutcliffiella sp. NPDC057660 TaxID=3346199 RepID=UPI0036837461
MRKVFAFIILTLLIGTAVYQQFSKEGEIKPASAKGEKAVDFKLESMGGNKVSLSDSLGKPVIINFWTTWCPPCKKEMPEIQRFYEDYKDEVDVLAVNITSNEVNKSVVEKHVTTGGFSFPILFDTEGLFRYYEVLDMPATFFIDEEGVIVGKHTGELDYDKLVVAKERLFE